MGLAGVRTLDNKQFFDPKTPLAVVYFDVDYEHNPKGEWEGSQLISLTPPTGRQQLLEEQVREGVCC